MSKDHARRRAKSRKQRETEEEEEGYADPSSFLQRQIIFLQQQLVREQNNREAMEKTLEAKIQTLLAERKEDEKKIEAEREKRDADLAANREEMAIERSKCDLFALHSYALHGRYLDTIYDSAKSSKHKAKLLSDEVRRVRELYNTLRRSGQPSYAALVTSASIAVGENGDENLEPASMTVKMVHETTYHKIVTLMEKERHLVVPGTDIVEIAVPDDVNKIKQEIKRRGSDLLKKRTFDHAPDRVLTKFDLDYWFWSQEDQTMSLQQFLNLLADVLYGIADTVSSALRNLEAQSDFVANQTETHLTSVKEIIEMGFHPERLRRLASSPSSTPDATAE